MLRGIRKGTPAVAVLADELRRRIYEFVRRAGRAVTRDEVASETKVSRKLAAFHLDKLVDRGLLRTHYARPPGRSGPGAGRTAKYYEPSDLQVEVSIPERRYDLAGHLLVRAVQTESDRERAGKAAVRVAREAGHQIGTEVRAQRRLGRPGAERALAAAADVLEEYGYEPYRPDQRTVALSNCPFHSLAREAPELVCRMNQAFINGLLRGFGNETVKAALECAPGDCCVTLRAPAGTARSSSSTT